MGGAAEEQPLRSHECREPETRSPPRQAPDGVTPLFRGERHPEIQRERAKKRLQQQEKITSDCHLNKKRRLESREQKKKKQGRHEAKKRERKISVRSKSRISKKKRDRDRDMDTETETET